MGQHPTDLREYRRGSRPGEDWTARWNTTDAPLIDGAAYDLAHRNVLRLTKGVNARSGLSWDAPDSDAGHANQILRCLVHPIAKFSGDATMATPILRGGGAAGAETCYRLIQAIDGATLALHKLVGGAATALGSAAVTPARLGGFYWYLFEATGTTIRVKFWADGDAEPAGWTVSAVDATIADGWIGWLHYYDTAVLDIPFFSIGTNGDAAPLESALPPSLDQWCLLPDIDPEITFGVERADAATGAISKKWYTTRGPRHTGPSDYPPNVEMESVILNAGGFGQRLEADALFAAQALNSIQQVELRNLPLVPNGPGLLDDWDGYTFAARPFEIRIGDRTQKHRAFELLATPSIDGEPEVTPDKGIIQLSNPSGAGVDSDRRPAALKQLLRVKKYVGIPTGVSILTTATSGASAPSNAAYDLPSFVACGRFRTSGLNNGGGTGFSALAERQISSTNRQFQVAMYWLGHATLAGRIQVDVSIGGVGVSIGQTTRYDDGQEHWWALQIKDQDRANFLVDGVVVLTSALTGPVDLPAAPWKWGVACKDALLFDHRMSTWISEDAIRSAMATRLIGTIPANWVAVWPGDDPVGNTQTDYSAMANHATLAGVENTNFRLDPTDAGMPEQAGRPMPLSLGVLFNSKAEMCDSLRGRFRVNDSAIPTGTALSPVKARGLPITLTTDYTLPAPGVIDMVTAQSEPVTYDLAPSPASPESPAIHFPRVVADAMVARHVAGTAPYFDAASFEALRTLLPYRGGGSFAQPPSGEDLLGLLGPLGAHYFQDRSGRVAGGHLLPPLNPGPYGQEGMLEFLGYPNCGATFPSNAAFDLNQTLIGGLPVFGIGCWIKIPRLRLDPAAALGTYLPTGQTLVDRVLGASGYYFGFDGRDGAVIFGCPGITGTATGLHYLSFAYPFLPDRLYFVACQQGFNGRSLVVYDGEASAGTSFSGEKSETTSGSMTVATGAPLRIGHGPRGSFTGWIGSIIGSSVGLSQSDWVDLSGGDQYDIRTQRWSQANVSASRWAQTRFLLNLNEGDGDIAIETVTGISGRIEGARWCPRLTLDFRAVTEPEFGGQRKLRPAWKTDARFRNNSSPVTGADVAASVTGAQRLALELPWLEAPLESQTIRDRFRDSRELLLESLLDDRAQAAAVGAAVHARFDPERRTADARKWRRAALRLMLTDEILLYHDRFGLSGGKPCRVASLATVLGDSPLTDISTWR